MFLEILKEYFANSQFHGLRYLAQNERHWIERIFWVICIVASWCGCIMLILSSLNAFQNNALSFGTDTSYIEWNTTLYSISVCEDDYDGKIERVAPEILGDIPDYNFYAIIKEFVFFKGSLLYSKSGCKNDDTYKCPKDGYKELTRKMRSLCNETFKHCQWYGSEFDCCEHFQVLETEFGPCFSLNSMQVKNPKYHPLIHNKITGRGKLILEFYIPVIVYVHGAEDVPNFNSELKEIKKVPLDLVSRKFYSITEIENDKDLKDIDINLRRCRYPDENDLSFYPYYSESACVVECRIKEQLRLCNCTSHLAPNARDDEICDFKGLLCLNDHFEDYSSIINPWTQKKGIVCPCLPSCYEPELDLLLDEENVASFVDDYDEDDYEPYGVIELILARLPTLRLKRIVVRSRLDLVVSLGGTVGLFVGASLLSFVEFAYFFTIRIYNTYKEKRGKKTTRKGNIEPLYRRNTGEKVVNRTNSDLLTSPNRPFPAQSLNSDIYGGYMHNNYYNRHTNNYLNSFYM